MEKYRKLSEEEIKMGFIASCIETVAETLKVSNKEILERMDKVGLIDKYIYPSYDALHTESRENLTDNLIDTLNLWENTNPNNE